MGLQCILRTSNIQEAETILGNERAQCEVFSIAKDLVGISIPTKIVDELGEEVLRSRLAEVAVFYLWEGAWFEQQPKKTLWKLW